MEPIDKLRQTRLEKLEKIKKLGINPYPSKSGKIFFEIENLSTKMNNIEIATTSGGIDLPGF